MIAAVYKTSQLTDIMRGLNASFDIELDVEYDVTCTWTGKIQYPAGRILAIWHKQRKQTGAAAQKTKSEIIMLELARTPPKFLHATQFIQPGKRRSTEEQGYLPLKLRDK